ncbi:MAG: hypothetical protein H6702_01620 [Myxococcales bacterium]|nr:hypothetical protein [Myxococcales bacterium]
MRTRLRHLAALVALAGCTSEDVAPALEGQLTVWAGRTGVVQVGERAGAVDPLSPARLFGVGSAARHTIRFDHPEGTLWIPEALGPAVDLRPLFADAPVVRGTRTQVTLPVERPLGQTLTVVALAADQVVRGVVQGDQVAIEVPGSGPVTYLGLWSVAGRAVALGRLGMSEVVEAPGGVRLRPTVPLTGTLLVDVVGVPAGWVTAELTLEGLRTGLVLGQGLAGDPSSRTDLRAGVSLPRPASGGLGPDAGLWVTATVRRVGRDEPVAQVATHLAASAEQAALEVPQAPNVAPVPATAPDGAVFVGAGTRDLAWRAGRAPTAVSVQLRGTDGCDAVAWRVVGDGAEGRLTVPAVFSRDPLALPLVRARIEAQWWGDLTRDGLLAPETVVAAAWPRVLRQFSRRAVEGWWRGGEASCRPDPRQGTYALRRGGACAPGGEAPRVTIDRCGRVIPLEEDSARAICGALDDDRFLARGGGAGAKVETDEAGVLRWTQGDQRWVLEPVGAVGLRPPAALAGDWYTATLREGGPDGPLTVSAQGAADRGPWLGFSDDGRVEARLPGLSFSGRLVDFDGRDGWVDDEGAACAGEVRRWAVTVDGDAVELSATLGERAVVLRAERR